MHERVICLFELTIETQLVLQVDFELIINVLPNDLVAVLLVHLVAIADRFDYAQFEVYVFLFEIVLMHAQAHGVPAVIALVLTLDLNVE